MAQPANPLPASTVVLVRPNEGGGFEVFMNRRPEKMETYAGVYVFPGGCVEKDDCSQADGRAYPGARANRGAGGT